MRNLDPFPTRIDLVRADNVLEVEWEDGATTQFEGARLRWACPCAECRGEAGQPGRLEGQAELDRDELQLSDVTLVGQYALQIAFASGHATGIYTFRYLRSLATQTTP